MRSITWFQRPDASGAVAVAAALTSYTILAAPGVGLAYRILGVDITIDEAAAATTRIRGNLRMGAANTFGVFGIIAGQYPMAQFSFGEGIRLTTNVAFVIQAIATIAATNMYVATRYVFENEG